jgi:ribonuclease T
MNSPPDEAASAAPPVSPAPPTSLMARRFRGFLPVVVDVETGGFNCATDALLEIAAVLIDMDEHGVLRRGATHSYHVKPFEGARLDPASLKVTGIDPWHPLRPAIAERDALQRIFPEIRNAMKAYDCKRAILVGHNASFDLSFINATVARCELKRNPFHPFSTFDTGTLAGAALGQTVLAKAVTIAGFEWDANCAHSAGYDAERTADLFCHICNRMRDSFREAEEKACRLGWLNSPPTEPVTEDPQMET